MFLSLVTLCISLYFIGIYYEFYNYYIVIIIIFIVLENITVFIIL